MSIAQQIADALNSDVCYDHGYCNKDAVVATDGRTIGFTFPAPVISGACWSSIFVNEDGSIHDRELDLTFANFDRWLEDLDALLGGGLIDE